MSMLGSKHVLEENIAMCSLKGMSATCTYLHILRGLYVRSTPQRQSSPVCVQAFSAGVRETTPVEMHSAAPAVDAVLLHYAMQALVVDVPCHPVHAPFASRSVFTHLLRLLSSGLPK
jgi:hypothetical protein